MKPYERIISIIMLGVISLSNVATPAAYAAQRLVVDFPAAQQSKGLAFATRPAFQVDQGSVLGASTSLLTVGTQELDLAQGNGGSANKRIAPRVERLAKNVYRTDEDVQLAVVNPDDEAFNTSVTDAKGQSVSVPITESNNGTTTTVDLAPSNQIKPGLYKVTITDADNKSVEQDFTWGVLALNTDKSMYHPGETADIAMAVLNDQGDMVCDATLQLKVKSSKLKVDDTLSTEATSDSTKIIVNPQCQKHDFSLEPDYEAHYTFGGAGNYQFTLTATTPKGTHTITDTIQVKDVIPFDLQRVSATRIYPPNTYPMLFNITANRDFNGTVTETVPDSFTITPATQSALSTGSGSSTPQSYSAMQTVYLNSNDPAAVMSQQIASGSGGLVMPFHGSYPITQGFGAQLTDPTLQAFYIHYGLAGHDGIDFGLPMNTPLYAVDDGNVIWSGPGDYGTMVTILHGWGQTYYGHMTNPAVSVGEHVNKGQLIGYSGMSGEATGPHLHFGMKPNNPDMTNGYYGKIDPMPFLPIGQGEPITALGAEANPVANLVYNTTVLGASDSAVTPTLEPTVSPTPTTGSGSSTGTPATTAEPTTTPAPSSVASDSAAQITVSPTPSQTPSVFAQPTTAANTNFSVLDQQIKLNEAIANNALTDKVKVLTWKVNLKKGQSTSLGYAYQAPHVSPQFYLLGPATFYSGGNDRVVFQEARQWEIASDDVGVEWYQNTTGSPFNGYSWQYRKKIDINSGQVSTSGSAPTVDFIDSGGDATNASTGNTNLTTTTGGFFNATSGSVTYDTANKETGPGSYIFTSGASGAVASASATATSSPNILADAGRRVSAYYRFANFPASASQTDTFMSFQTSGNIQVFALRVTSAGVLQLVGGPVDTMTTINNGGSGTTFSTNTWYRISVGYTITNTSTYTINVYVGGTLALSANSSGTNIGTGTSGLFLGWVSPNDGNSMVMNIDDIYVDSGTTSDTGDVHVTAKMPFANGASSAGVTAGSPTGFPTGATGHAQYVGERPLDTSAEIQVPKKSADELTVEAATHGDVDISSDVYIANQAWSYAKMLTTCTTPALFHNGSQITETLATTDAMYSDIQTSTSYPSGNAAVGWNTCTDNGGTHTMQEEEMGIQIAYSASSPPGTLTNFPVAVNITSDNDLKAHAQSSCSDVVFTDSTGRSIMTYEIEDVASANDCSNGNLAAWVKIPSLSNTTDTILYMYYGNPSATTQSNASSTWSGANYTSVYHADASGHLAQETDSTGNNQGTVQTASGSLSTDTLLGPALTFPTKTTITSYVSSASSFNEANNWDLEAWIKTTDASGNPFISGEASQTGSSGTFDMHVAVGTDGKVYIGYAQTGQNQIGSTLTYNDGNWHHVVGTILNNVSGPVETLYVDGSQVATQTFGAQITSTTSWWRWGEGSISVSWPNMGSGGSMDGSMDEVHIGNTVQTAGWIQTEYNEGRPTGNTFETIGTAETSIYAPTMDKVLGHGEWFDSTGTRQPFVF